MDDRSIHSDGAYASSECVGIQDLRARAAARLAESGSPDPEPDADWLLCAALNCGRGELRNMNRSASGVELDAFERLLARRESGEPLQYILGTQPFLQYELRTDSRALIPRGETEELCLLALEYLRSMTRVMRYAAHVSEPFPRVLDIGTGTGALAIAIALECPGSDVTAVDISSKAAELAHENATALNARVEILVGDMFAPVGNRRFDMIVSNPPYIPRGELETLQREVQREPVLALDGGVDGLDFYRRIANEARAHLNPGGLALVECGAGQAREVERLFAAGIGETFVRRDMQGVERMVGAVTGA